MGGNMNKSNCRKMLTVKMFTLIGCLVFMVAQVKAENIAGWDVVLQKPLIYEKELNHTREVQIYTGDFIMQETHKKATPGNQFVLAHVSVKKMGSAAPAFNPNLFALKGDEKTYLRMDDDAFLVDFSLNVLPHLNMRYGSYDAYLVFETPVTLKKAELFYNEHLLQPQKN